MLKRNLKVLCFSLATTLLVATSSVPVFADTVSVKEINMQNEVVYNQEALDKYSSVFQELEEALANPNQRNAFNVSRSSDTQGVISTTVSEGDSIITLGIIYEEVEVQPYDGSTSKTETEVNSRAKVALTSTFNKTSSGLLNYITLEEASGDVIAVYNGNSITNIRVVAGQDNPYDKGASRSETSSFSAGSYSKRYNWPDMKYEDDMDSFVIGHNATFTLKDGYKFTVICNYK